MTETRGFIYQITNLVNGKAYIGKTEKTVAQRFSQHVKAADSGSSYPLHGAMRKYGVENFSVAELVSFESHLLNDAERAFIALYGTFGETGYNSTIGGDGARSRTCNSKALSAKAGSKVNELRKERGWTQRELADKIGIDQPFTSRIIRGEVEPGLVTMASIAQAFELTLSELLEGVSL